MNINNIDEARNKATDVFNKLFDITCAKAIERTVRKKKVDFYFCMCDLLNEESTAFLQFKNKIYDMLPNILEKEINEENTKLLNKLISNKIICELVYVMLCNKLSHYKNLLLMAEYNEQDEFLTKKLL